MLIKHIPSPPLEAECGPSLGLSRHWAVLWLGDSFRKFFPFQYHNISNKDLPSDINTSNFFRWAWTAANICVLCTSPVPPITHSHGKASYHLRAQALILVQTSNAVNSNPCFKKHSKNTLVQEFTEWLPVIVSFSAGLLPLTNKELLATPRFQRASLIKGPRSPPHKPTETWKEWKMCAQCYCKICTYVFLCLAGSCTAECGKYFLFICKL